MTVQSPTKTAEPSWIEGWVLDVFPLAVAALGVFLLPPGIRSVIGGPLSTDSSSVYGALVGLQGSLLGFVLAALTIVLGYSQSPSMEILRKSGQLPNLFRVYLAGIRSHAFATVTAIVALVVNSGYVTASLLAWLVASSSVVTAIRLGRSLWATRSVVVVVSKDRSRGPGVN